LQIKKIMKLYGIKVSKLFLFVGIFLLTLVSHTIYSWAIGLLFVLVYIGIEKIPLKKKPLYESWFFLFLIIIAVIRFHLFVKGDVLPLYSDAFLGNTARFVLCVGVWFSIRLITLDDKIKHLISLIAPLLKLHVAIFYIQFITYLLIGYYIDFVEPFTGEESRYAPGFTESFVGVGGFRPTGLLVEPSTYFFVVLTLAILLLISSEFSNHVRLFIFTVVSMFLSFSTAAIIIATLFVCYIIYEQKLSWRFYLITSLCVIPMLFLSTSKLNELYQTQVKRIEGSAAEIRLNLVEMVMNRDIENVISAHGVYAIDDNISKETRAVFRGREVSSINDAGLFIYMWARLGYLGIVYFIILCTWQYKLSRNRLLLFLLLSLTKIGLFHPLFVFYFAYSISNKI